MLDRRMFMGSILSSGAVASGAAHATTDMGLSGNTARDDAIVPLALHMLQTRLDKLPIHALNTTRAQLLDTVGVALAGRKERGVRELLELAATIGGKGESVAWGSGLRLPSHDAARINAVMVHALEYDDTFGPGFLHPSAIIFPAALAVADMIGNVSGKQLLGTATLANDVACRVSIAGQPGVDGFAIGWHNTTLIGYLSSALVAGRLMQLNRDQLIHAVGIACHQAAGNAQSHIDGALTKRMGPGFASAAGIMAARLAARGVTGPRDILEGAKGWFSQYHKGNYSRALLLDGLGAEFPGAAMSFKPWPSCRGSHTSADAALQIADALGSRTVGIKRIVIRNGPAEWSFLSAPIERKRQPATTVEAQFSIPWVVAAALTDGKVGIAHFTPQALTRPDVRAMAARVETVEDHSLANPAGGPGQAVVEVTTSDGRTVRRHVAAAKGDPQVPMSPAEAAKKFDDCLDHAGIEPSRRAHLRALLDGVDGLGDVAQLTAAMS
jgi:2-methylcitrate dehydratase PrpD